MPCKQYEQRDWPEIYSSLSPRLAHRYVANVHQVHKWLIIGTASMQSDVVTGFALH